MSFQKNKIEDFLIVFEKQKEFIESFEGCNYLELLRDKNDGNVFFTYSYWNDESYLELYRKSDFFKDIWSNVKTMFNDKPLAWSLSKIS